MHKMLMHFEKSVGPKESITNDSRLKGEVVHSGHFMISSVADDQEENEEVIHDRDSPIHHEQSIIYKYGGYDFSNVNKETKNTYQFGRLSSNQITIDASLARLFQCMSLAYHGGKVVSPKWKNFKGLKLTVKDKIRLNNAIWRTWHIQYVMRKRKQHSAIQFASPLEIDTNAHSRPEAVVMEGKYWKRRIETVVAEYKKWRGFFMDKLKLSDYPGLMWVSESASNSPSKEPLAYKKNRSNDEMLGTEFTDTLFNNLHQPFHFPNPREIAMHATNSDIMQPGLLQLQPSVEDVEFDAFQELLNPTKKSVVSFNGNTTNSSVDLFPLTDYNHMTDDQNLVVPSPLRNVSSFTNQPMDFVGSFTDTQAQNDLPLLHDTITNVDTIFSGVGETALTFQHLNGMQHDQQHPTIQHQRPSIMRDFISVNPHAHQAPHIEAKVPTNDMHHQHYHQPKPTNSTISKPAFHHNQNNFNGLISGDSGVQQVYYPHSKHVNNTPANNSMTYSISQTSQPVNFYPQPANSQQQPMIVVNQQSMNTMSQVDLTHSAHATPLSMSTAPVVNHSGHQAMDVGSSTFQQPTSNAVTSNSVIIRRLLVKNTTPSESAPSRRKRNSSNTNSPMQSKPSNQFSPVAFQASLNPLNNSMISPASSQKSSVNFTEKRKTSNDSFSSPSINSDVWPQKRRNSIETNIRFKQDVNMESFSTEPIASLSQDNDKTQMDSISSQNFSTEQKRRFNIKMGFVRLQTLLPGSSSHANSKISKASLLGKTAQYIKTMQNERTKIKEEIENLKLELQQLQHSINVTQMELPATGAPIPRPRTDKAKTKFQSWIKHRTKQNWKFFLFGTVVEPWFEAYHNIVSVSGFRVFCRTINQWLDEHCSLRELRTNVVRSLQVMCTTTNILTNPALLQKQIEASVKDQDNIENERTSNS